MGVTPYHPDEINPDQYYRLPDILHACNFSVWTLYYHIRRGNLIAYRPGNTRSYLIKGSDFLDWLLQRVNSGQNQSA